MTTPTRAAAIKTGRRLRRAAAVCFVAAALWAAVMIFSAFRWFGYVGPGWLADIGDGTLYTNTWGAQTDNFSLRGWNSGSNNNAASGQPFTWTLWQWGLAPLQNVGGAVAPTAEAYSIWPLTPLLAAAGATLLYVDRTGRARRARLNLCFNCGYPRKDIPQSSPCPECGRSDKPEESTPPVNVST